MKQRMNRRIISTVGALAALCGSAGAAGDFATSTIATGIQSILSDVSGFLVILSPIAGGCMAVYFVIRKSMADEQDGKMWTKRAMIAVGCGVGGMLVSGVISLLSGYFS